MKKVLVIGGGFSGLAAACYLSHNKFDVTLIESTHKLGGKTHSFQERNSKIEIDNGQHILLGCYFETLNFLRLISAIDKIKIQDEFSINYLTQNFKVHKLKSSNVFYPLNLLYGLFSFSLLGFKDKLSLLRLLLKVKFTDTDSLQDISVKKWLENENQTQASIRLFWEVICVGALNTSTDVASAKLFCEILKQIFWTGSNSFKIILPENSLNDTFIYPIESFLKKNNVRIFKAEKCEKVIVFENKITEVKTDKRNLTGFDYYLMAVPFYSLKSLEILNTNNLDIKYSPILNAYLWLNNNPLKEPFYAFTDSLIHWLFNKGDFINITISNAVSFISKSKSEIENLLLNELKKFIPDLTKEVRYIVIVKEKKATFIPSNENLGKRLNSKTEISNLFLAGDWTNTKLPSTIEGAIKSGRIAAEEIIKDYFDRK